MSTSHEKSPTEMRHQGSTPSAAKHFLFCDWGAGLCNPGLLAGHDLKTWSLQMGQIPAAPAGLEVGTNPPSLPTEDQRWEGQ